MRFHELDSLMPDQLDFVPRERRGQIGKLLVAFGLAIVAVFVASYIPFANNAAAYAPIIAMLVIVLLGVYVILRSQISLDLIMSSEYQSMLLAQAFGAGAGFGMVVRRDGTIMHASAGMDSIFPSFDYAQSKALDGVFEQGLVRQSDRERILGAIRSGTADRLVFSIAAAYQETKEYIITVEPMQRPSGFCVIRGREYLGKRAGLQLMPDALSLTCVDKLEHMLTTTSIPHFTTDAFGKIEYANPAFDRALGYESGEIIAAKLSLHHLIFSLGQSLVTEEYTLNDYVGAVELIHKHGSRIRGTLQQNMLRDGHGKSIGATGTLAVAA
jgi:PAS domain-containing protein